MRQGSTSVTVRCPHCGQPISWTRWLVDGYGEYDVRHPGETCDLTITEWTELALDAEDALDQQEAQNGVADQLNGE